MNDGIKISIVAIAGLPLAFLASAAIGYHFDSHNVFILCGLPCGGILVAIAAMWCGVFSRCNTGTRADD